MGPNSLLLASRVQSPEKLGLSAAGATLARTVRNNTDLISVLTDFLPLLLVENVFQIVLALFRHRNMILDGQRLAPVGQGPDLSRGNRSPLEIPLALDRQAVAVPFRDSLRFGPLHGIHARFTVGRVFKLGVHLAPRTLLVGR